MISNSQVKDIFKNQTVFLTGGTGFLGKVIIEKLLRECEDVGRIYILVRSKKGKNLEVRYNEIFEQPCFDLLKSRNINVKEKVFLISGDCLQPLLGINSSDLEILKNETNFVFHLAANVKFDQSLKEASFIVRATKDLVELAKEMSNLKAFVYVSTAYSNCINSHIKEEVYEPPMKPELFLELVDSLDDNVLQNITPQLLGKYPNTYVFSKCISESLVGRAAEYFPTAIIRPGIVINSVEEPLKGWIDNIYGPIGICVGAALGVISTFHAKKSAVANIVPVDLVCNCTLAATIKMREKTSTKTAVYNYVRFNHRPITWGEYCVTMDSYFHRIGLNKILWHYTFTLRENKVWNDVCVFFLHTLPAYFIDGILMCLGKPKIAIKTYGKVDRVLGLTSYFTTRTWIFDDDNVKNLEYELNEKDKRAFILSRNDIDWEEYLLNTYTGTTKYVVKETFYDTSFAHRAKMKAFMVAHYVVIAVFWYLVYLFFSFVFK